MQLASLDSHAPLTRCFSVVAELLYTFLAGCLRWIMEEHTNVQRGEVNPATTVEDCVIVCLNNASCYGVDWNPAAEAGQRCWLSGPWSGPKNLGGALGIRHYDIIRNCTGKSVGYNR